MAYLHHAVVHLPIALGLAAAAFLVLAWARPTGPWEVIGRACLALAALGAVMAAATGLLSAGHVVEQGGDAGKVTAHRNWALAATALLAAAGAVTWLGARRDSRRWQKAGGLLAVSGALVVAVAADFAGDFLHPGLAPWSEAPHHHGPLVAPSGSGSGGSRSACP